MPAWPVPADSNTYRRAASASKVDIVNEATVLVARYPEISSAETARLAEIFPRLPVVDLAVMMSDVELGPRLDQFTRDQQGRLKRPMWQILATIAPAALFLVVLAVAVLTT